MALDRAFESKDDARALQDELKRDGGVGSHPQALAADLARREGARRDERDHRAAHYKNAAYERAEGEKVLLVKNAGAAHEDLSGRHARQRKAIVGSIATRSRPSARTSAVRAIRRVELLLLTQYFDTLREIGAQPQATTALCRRPARRPREYVGASRALYGSSELCRREPRHPAVARGARGRRGGGRSASGHDVLAPGPQSFPMMTTPPARQQRRPVDLVRVRQLRRCGDRRRRRRGRRGRGQATELRSTIDVEKRAAGDRRMPSAGH